MQQKAPAWNPGDLPGSIRTYAEWVRGMAVRTFLEDKTHVELFFFLKAAGPSSIFPVPPKVDRKEMLSAIRATIKAEDIYGVIHIAEAWTYVPAGRNDHTVKQIMDGEIKVSELNEKDRKEALLVSVESREGGCELWFAQIVRDGKGNVTLGGEMRRIKNSLANWEPLFSPATGPDGNGK